MSRMPITYFSNLFSLLLKQGLTTGGENVTSARLHVNGLTSKTRQEGKREQSPDGEEPKPQGARNDRIAEKDW